MNDEEILTLARWAIEIEDHYGKPMDIEWAKDGDGTTTGTGKLFIVQARPETVHSLKRENFYEVYKLKGKGEVICTGLAIGSKIGQGNSCIIKEPSEIHLFKPGQVLVTDMTDPDWEPIMKIAGAIVTNRGGRTCHAAIVSRELGIPCVVGAGNATEVIKNDEPITVDCSKGEEGRVLKGIIPYEVKRIDLTSLPNTKTKIMMNVGIPEQAFIQGQIPSDGVGLARIEFIISSHIGVHPLALIEYPKLKQQAQNNSKIARIVKEIEKKNTNV